MGLIIRYQSPQYKPELVIYRYLYIEFWTGKVIVDEVNSKKLTVRSYELPESEYNKYSEAISKAEKIQRCYPRCVDMVENRVSAK